MDDNVIFEIVRYEVGGSITKGGVYKYDIKNPRYTELNRYGLLHVEVAKAMYEIADIVNNEIGRGIAFTVE